MPKKVSSPLQNTQKEAESIKKKVDDFIKECEKKKYADEKDKNSNKFKKIVKRGDDLLTECGKIQEKIETLDAANEAKEVDDFDDQKKIQEQNIVELKKSLSKTLHFIQTGEEEDEDVEEEIEEEEVEEEEEVDEGETDDEEEEVRKEVKKLAAAPDLEKDVESKDVIDGKKKKEEKKDEDDEEEEEEYEEEASEEEEEEEEEYEEEAEEEEEEEEQEEYTESMTMRQFEAIVDYVAQQPEDLGFEVGDILTILSTREDGWWEAMNTNGDKGMVPSTYLKEHNKYAAIQKEEAEPDESTGESTKKRHGSDVDSGKMLWKGIKDAIKETSATDVLHALGAIPSGFRQTTLGGLKKDDVYTLRNSLAPKLSTSNMFYRDLFLNPSTNKIRMRNVRVQRILQIQSCRQIPLPGSGVEITGRCVRVCLFDGKNVLSNIHIIRCNYVDKEMKTWGCSLKVNDIMKCLDYGEFFIRTNSSEAELGVLFELAYQFVRKTGEEGEMSVGWTHLPLFEQNGAPMGNKTYDLPINGGTIYEKGVEVDPDVGKTDLRTHTGSAGTNRFRTMMSSKKQPRLFVKAFMPNKEQKDQLDTLPDVIIGSSLHIPFLSYYRQVLADELLRDRVDINSTEIIHNPMLVSFPSAAEQHDIMDAIRFAWIEKLKITRRQDKREQEQLKDLFSQTYMESGYPLLNLNTLPEFVLGDNKIEDLRLTEISRFTQITRDKKSVLAALLSPDISYKPFNIKELSYEVAGQFCLVKN